MKFTTEFLREMGVRICSKFHDHIMKMSVFTYKYFAEFLKGNTSTKNYRV